jgi:hypothetical protein
VDRDDRVGVTVAAAPFPLWRVFEDIRATAPITPEHARYVGAETKLIDGRRARPGALARGVEYYVAVAPNAYEEIRTSLGAWMGYALAPRRRTTDPEDAGWIVTWGATPAELGVHAGRPKLVVRRNSGHVATSVRRVVTPPVIFAAAMAPLLLTQAGEDQSAR